VAVAAASLGLLAQPAAAQSPSDREIAKTGVFQADDFPAGWRATPPKKTKTDIGDCPVLKKAGWHGRQRTAQSMGKDFERNPEVYRSAANIYRTEAAARRVYEAVASENLRRCYTRLVEDELKSSVKKLGASDLKAELGERTGSRSYGDESTDFEIKITVSKDSLNQEVFADVAFVRVGRALGGYLYITEGEPSSDTCSEFSSDDCVNFDELITSATDRLITATGGQPNSDSGTTTASTQR
jgi:hypothetical protein